MKNLEITTGQFYDYLESLDLFRWNITSTKTGIEAILGESDDPKLSDFTQVKKNDDGTWLVRLSKADYFNELITKGFFD